MEKKQPLFTDLSFHIKKTIKIGKYFFPIKVDIKNIYYSNVEELDAGLLVQSDDPFYFEYNKLKEIEYYSKYLKHINTEDVIFSNFTKNFLEYHKIKNINELFHIADIDRMDLNHLVSEVQDMEKAVISEYRRRLYSMLKLDVKKPYIKYTPNNPKSLEVEEYTRFTQAYIEIQALKEYNPTVFFEENIGKAISKWSLREIELHLSYITQKYRIEEINNLWEAKYMEDSRKNTPKR